MRVSSVSTMERAVDKDLLISSRPKGDMMGYHVLSQFAQHVGAQGDETIQRMPWKKGRSDIQRKGGRIRWEREPIQTKV